MYSPYGSYPCPYPQQNTYMPQPASMQMPSQTQSSETMLLQVGSAKDFDSVTLQPGRKALIMAQNEPFLAFKSADQMGMVQTTLYRIEMVTPEQIEGPKPEYVTRQELEQYVASMMSKPARKTQAKEETE